MIIVYVGFYSPTNLLRTRLFGNIIGETKGQELLREEDLIIQLVDMEELKDKIKG